MKTVLFADDEQHYLEPLKIKIETKGYRVLAAINIADAINILKTNEIDVLVLDIMMDPGEGLRDKLDPSIAGVQALDLFKATSPNTKIICLSVKEDTAILKEIRKRGIPFIGKGETSLRTVAAMIDSKITGIIKDADLIGRRGRKWEAR
jgi:CheY-like chemotaxis protein